MKRTLIILLVFSFLYGSVGYITTVKVMQERVYRSAPQQQVNRSSLLRIPRDAVSVMQDDDRKEISFQGGLYDVVSEDARYYYCLRDSHEEGLIEEICEFVKDQIGKGKPDGKSKLVKQQEKDYFFSVIFVHFLPASPKFMQGAVYMIHLPRMIFEKNTPPPELG